jgi:hypothetical protein
MVSWSTQNDTFSHVIPNAVKREESLRCSEIKCFIIGIPRRSAPRNDVRDGVIPGELYNRGFLLIFVSE